MLEAGGNAAYAIAKARTSVALSRDYVSRSRTAINRSRDPLANLTVYPFTTCVEPCCGFRVPSRSAALHVDTPAELRAQAAHARKLADEMYNRTAQAELRQIADGLDKKADEIERRELSGPIRKPNQEA